MKNKKINKEISDELYKLKASVLQSLAHPIRLKIVDCLSNGEKCVYNIVEAVGGERTNISRHLSVLLKADILASRKEGLNIYYNLKMPCALNFLSCAEEVIKKQLDSRLALLKKK